MSEREVFKMEYWVYENWRAEHKAIVHAETCGFCNHGRGTNKPKPHDDANGRWRGPFPTLAAARTAARQTGRPSHPCRRCL